MKRNNAALSDGVSRMSPWIHYGMISTTRMVRDASSIGGKGAEKFLDEMLVFREHAQHHVHAKDNPDDWANIPGWAIASWNDRGPGFSELSAIELERGKSGDRLWDSAQTGLLRHGTMHNNVRMTWGKAFAGWREDAEEAMHLALEMNDRFALDGRDPSSIAGVQWCFGLFDRAFGPVDPIMGKVRKRPTHVHENRIDMTAYEELTNKATMGASMDIGIVGGGLSGMFAARLLSDLGHNVTVWDKGSRIGGRLTGWQTDEGSKIHLGARALDSVPRWMDRFVDEWTRLGLVSREGDALIPHAPLPELLEHLSEGSSICLGSRVSGLEIMEGGIRVTTESDGDGEVCRCDRVIVAVPVEQASEIASDLGIDIDGESIPSIVAWGFCDSIPEEVPDGFRIHDLGNSTTMVELSTEMSGQLIDLDKRSLSKIITDSIGISGEDWKSHKWRYSRASSGPGSVVTKDGVSFIGDAFGREIGSAGAALDSASRAVSNLHLSILEPAFGRRPVQSSLADW